MLLRLGEVKNLLLWVNHTNKHKIKSYVQESLQARDLIRSGRFIPVELSSKTYIKSSRHIPIKIAINYGSSPIPAPPFALKSFRASTFAIALCKALVRSM